MLRTLYRGCRGDDVVDWQRELDDLGYDLGPAGVDGDFGRRTHAATVAFQRAAGLSPDGVVGEEEWFAVETDQRDDVETSAVIPPDDPAWMRPLVPTVWPADRIREALVLCMESIDGLEAWKRSLSRARFVELIGQTCYKGQPYPWDLDGKRQVWTCGLTYEGILRWCRIDNDAHHRCCPPGQAVVRTTRYARTRKAWVAPCADRRPEPGDAYVVGGVQHVRCLIGWDGDVAYGVHGGQLDAVHGRQAVTAWRRAWVKTGGRWVEKGTITHGWYDAARFGWRDEPRLLPTS